MKHIRIIPAVREDIPFLAECRFGMFQEMYPENDYGSVKGAFLKEACDYFSRHFGDHDLVSVCARTDDKMVGCGTIMFNKRPPHIKNFDNLFGYILNVFVCTDFRRRGVGTQIMAALKQEAEERGVKRIGLIASETGATLYKTIGYESKPNYMETRLS